MTAPVSFVTEFATSIMGELDSLHYYIGGLLMDMMKQIGNVVEEKLEYLFEERPSTMVAAAWGSYLAIVGLVGMYYFKDYRARVHLTNAINHLSELVAE